eukprot:2684153-Pyramimonas_sp.AAC.1
MRGRRHCWNRIVKDPHPKEDDITLRYVDLTAEGTLDTSPPVEPPPEPPPSQEKAESPGQVLLRVAAEIA